MFGALPAEGQQPVAQRLVLANADRQDDVAVKLHLGDGDTSFRGAWAAGHEYRLARHQGLA